jgi:hypothetical protein
MVAVFPLAAEERITLQGVSWKFYESMLQELGKARVVRVAYDRGMLEIMSPLMPHERGKCGIDLLIAALAEAFSSSAINKLALYAAMGVPEFWRYDGQSWAARHESYVCSDSGYRNPSIFERGQRNWGNSNGEKISSLGTGNNCAGVAIAQILNQHLASWMGYEVVELAYIVSRIGDSS